MKRTPIARKTPLRAKAPMKRSSRPKSTAARAGARDRDCTLMYRGCVNDTTTVVLCHLRQFSGGGTGVKPDDTEAVYGCHYCHDILDGRREKPNIWTVYKDDSEIILWALIRTHRVMRADGILILKGD